VAGQADPAEDPLVDGRGEPLDGPAGRGEAVELVGRGAVEEVDVQPVGPQGLERPLQVAADLVGAGGAALGGQDDLVAPALERTAPYPRAVSM